MFWTAKGRQARSRDPAVTRTKDSQALRAIAVPTKICKTCAGTTRTKTLSALTPVAIILNFDSPSTILLGTDSGSGAGPIVDLECAFNNIGNMETLAAADLLAALGHETRLSIFRLLVEAGPEGLVASAIGEQLGLAPATLSFHLAHLSRVGLIRGRKESRFIRYSTDYATMDDLLAFLTNNCCQGQPCLPKTAASDTIEKRRSGPKPCC